MTSHQRALNREETKVACPHGPPATSRNALPGSLFLDKLTRGLAVYPPRFWGLPGPVTAGQAQSLGPQELAFPPAMRQTQKLAVTTSRLDYPVEVVHLSKRALKIITKSCKLTTKQPTLHHFPNHISSKFLFFKTCNVEK